MRILICSLINTIQVYRVPITMQSRHEINEVQNTSNFGKASSQNEHQLVGDEKTLEGTWSLYENLRFTIFLDLNRSLFISKGRRKSERIFTRLSEYVSTRTSRQCRSHYQKMMIKYHTISKLRSYFRKAATPSAYDAEFQRLQESGSLLQEELFPQLVPVRVRNFADKAIQTQKEQSQVQNQESAPFNLNFNKNFSSAPLNFPEQQFFLYFPTLNLFYTSMWM